MSASFVAGFWMVFVAFVVAAVEQLGKLTGDWIKDGFILATVLSNIVFFYSFGVLAEHNGNYQNFIRKRGNAEWYLRVLSNVLLLGVPLGLEKGALPFCVVLMLFYASLLVWDVVVFAKREPAAPEDPKVANPMPLDIFGFFLSILLLADILMYSVPRADREYESYILGGVTVGFGIIAAFSISSAWPALRASLGEHKV